MEKCLFVLYLSIIFNNQFNYPQKVFEIKYTIKSVSLYEMWNRYFLFILTEPLCTWQVEILCLVDVTLIVTQC